MLARQNERQIRATDLIGSDRDISRRVGIDRDFGEVTHGVSREFVLDLRDCVVVVITEGDGLGDRNVEIFGGSDFDSELCACHDAFSSFAVDWPTIFRRLHQTSRSMYRRRAGSCLTRIAVSLSAYLACVNSAAVGIFASVETLVQPKP